MPTKFRGEGYSCKISSLSLTAPPTAANHYLPACVWPQLREQESHLTYACFWASGCQKPQGYGQKTSRGYNIQQMLEI
ncbi:hypothetical protein KCP74_17040 [Salmonella enterica subsp. enterica]|nr:hypothetical protein KCP74_17040 [Salmonella enterica subsp. enterica]